MCGEWRCVRGGGGVANCIFSPWNQEFKILRYIWFPNS